MRNLAHVNRGLVGELPPLYVRVSPGSPPAPFLLFDVEGDGFSARELTPAQVNHVARQRGLRVVAVKEGGV